MITYVLIASLISIDALATVQLVGYHYFSRPLGINNSFKPKQ